MKQLLKNKFVLVMLIMTFVILLGNKAYAKSYSIESMDIQATLQEDGSLDIIQTLEYKFSGSYNGVYITIPVDLDDEQYNENKRTSVLDDSLYNANGVVINKIVSDDVEFTQTETAYNGNSGVYTLSYSSGLYTLKIYSPSENVTKKFAISYTLNNVAVQHEDYGEVFYNFIGGEWDVAINNLNIDFYLPNNIDYTNVFVWLHGPYNGEWHKLTADHINAQFTIVRSGEYAALRTLFPLSNIPNATKTSGYAVYNLVVSDEEKISESAEDKENFTLKVIALAMILLVYWLILMWVYEKDKLCILHNDYDDEIFEKYNPLIAGCIQGSREVLARDIIAVLLGLVDKKVVMLENMGAVEKNKNYNYFLRSIPENEGKMDDIEKYIYNWFFQYSLSTRTNESRTQNLEHRLKEMPHEKDAVKKFENLNKMAMKELNDLGANKAKVPKFVRFLNNLLFVACIIIVIAHIQFNGLSIYSPSSIGTNIVYLFYFGLILFPVLIYVIYIPIALIVKTRHAINRLAQKISGQKIIATSISITLIWMVVIILTGLLSSSSYLIADEVLLCVAMLIMFTDNLMLKNEVTMIEDFSKINNLKYKIENYSMLDSRDVEYIELWDKYLVYAVAFGISGKIVNKIKGLYIDSDLCNLVTSDFYKNYMRNDYEYFYDGFSKDSRFLREYKKAANTTAKAWASSSGGSSGSGSSGHSSGGGGFSRRRRSWRPEVAHFNKKTK